jgi:histidine triad (HIT) family protein
MTSVSDTISKRQTIFTKIIAGEIPCSKVYEDETVFAFKDISPVAPIHILVVPKIPYRDLLEVDSETFASISNAIKLIAHQEGFSETGFRTVINTGASAGQTVFHLHFHLIAGRNLNWPPG